MPDVPVHLFDYVERLKRELSTFFFCIEDMQKLVELSASRQQIAEDVAYAMIVERFIDTSAGAQLDQWGKVVGEARLGLVDGEYRQFIKARIRSNLSNGTIREMTLILKLLTNAINVRYSPLYPAGMQFDYVSGVLTSSASKDRIKRQMIEVAGAGIAVHYITEATEGYFGWDGDDEALGFGQGSFAGVI